MVSNSIDGMVSLIKDHYLLNRTGVNRDTDKLVDHIKDLLACNVMEIDSGKECLTWLMPKHWEVREGYLARLDGTRIVDYKVNPLHLWTHSVSFQGRVTRQDLESHLSFDPLKPEWTPYHYRNGYRYDAEDWGFSLSHNTYQTLTDEYYQVNIDTDLDNNGTLKIVDHWLKGQFDETIFIAAHTCHPGIVTDGLSCVAVAVELFKRLAIRSKRRYSYRLILGPEYFAAAGFLATVPESEVELLRGGIFLDMLGNNEPLGFQSSFQGDSRLDQITTNVFKHHVENHIERPYRKLWGNDEMFYNGPGFLIPTLGIGGGRHSYYHFDRDDFQMLNISQLQSSVDLLLKIIDIIEQDFVPIPKYKGPLYLSRFGLYVDANLNRDEYDQLEYIQILADGKRSCFDIANQLSIDFSFVYSFFERLEESDLIDKAVVNCFTAT